jgi:hypothetical protein
MPVCYGCRSPAGLANFNRLLVLVGDALLLRRRAICTGRRVILCTMISDHGPDLSTFSDSGLFSLYRAILAELKSRGVIRTENAPVGDYAEYLVATALGGKLAPNSEKSWDVLAKDGEKLQVKARVVSDPPEPGQLQLSPFRSFDFDSAVIVLLAATDYSVSRASKLPRGMVEAAASYREHVNGRILFARKEIMDHANATDLTATLRAAQNEPVRRD